jgi:hypothetical protein
MSNDPLSMLGCFSNKALFFNTLREICGSALIGGLCAIIGAPAREKQC